MPPEEAHAELHQPGVADQKSHHQTSRNRQQKEPAKGREGQPGEQDKKDCDRRNGIRKLPRPRNPNAESDGDSPRAGQRSSFSPEGEFGPGHEKDGHPNAQQGSNRQPKIVDL